MEKQTVVKKKFLTEGDPSSLDDSFISTAVISTSAFVQAGFCLYNGEQSHVQRWQIPLTDLDGLQAKQLKHFDQAMTTIIGQLQDLLNRVHLRAPKKVAKTARSKK